MQSRSEVSPNIIPNEIIDEQIEILIQQTYNITIPSIVIKFTSQNEENFDKNDLLSFYSQFGEVIKILQYHKFSIVLYKKFFSADACFQFLQNENNFKANMRKKITVNWLNLNKNYFNFPNNIQKLFAEIHNNNLINLQKVNNTVNYEKNQFETNLDFISKNIIKFNQISETIPDKMTSSLSMSNLYKNSQTCICPVNSSNQINEINNNSINVINQIRQEEDNKDIPYLNQNINQINQSNNTINNDNLLNINTVSNKNANTSINKKIDKDSININNLNDKSGEKKNKNEIKQTSENKNKGKYICKYSILIPNDDNFQVVKKIIGVKGCNMKKIVNECTNIIDNKQIKKNKNEVKNNVKLRLRGIGSGYKEGKNKLENNEPLHLYVSAINEESMKKCCELIDELLEKIYNEYIIFCKKNNITPLATKIAQKVAFGGKFIKKSK